MPIITDCITKISTQNFRLNKPNEKIVKEVLMQNVVANRYPRWKTMVQTIQDTLLLGESATPVNSGVTKRFSFKKLNPFAH